MSNGEVTLSILKNLEHKHGTEDMEEDSYIEQSDEDELSSLKQRSLKLSLVYWGA